MPKEVPGTISQTLKKLLWLKQLMPILLAILTKRQMLSQQQKKQQLVTKLAKMVSTNF
ncbi:hypothetical protein SMA679_0225 [Streptococcus macedonicus]|nr:hypothetical protein SMA679_0225 [Streptococcus macedonicus]